MIIEKLNGLPLALTQAGIYLRQTNMAALDYVTHYDSTWTDLMKKQGRFPLQEYADRSVLTTWTISYEQVRSQSEAAAGLLRLWGFLDCGDLWYKLIASVSRRRGDIETPDWLQRLAESELDFLGALQVLSSYSLVDAKETSSHSIHSVLHKWCYQLAEGSERRVLSWLAACIVASSVPADTESEYWKLRKRLFPHGNRVCRWVDEHLEQSHGANGWALPPWIFFKLGVLYADQGKLDEAEKMYVRTLTECEKAPDVEYIITLDTFNNLGRVYFDQNKLDKAEKIYQRVLIGTEKIVDAEHISTLNTVDNLGSVYRRQGKLDEAEKMYQRARIGKEKALGAEHISTLNTIQDLGTVYLAQSKLAEAEKMYSQALTGFQKSLGSSHEKCRHIQEALRTLRSAQGMIIY